MDAAQELITHDMSWLVSTLIHKKLWDPLMLLAMVNSCYHPQGDFVIKRNVVNLKKGFPANLQGL